MFNVQRLTSLVNYFQDDTKMGVFRTFKSFCDLGFKTAFVMLEQRF